MIVHDFILRTLGKPYIAGCRDISRGYDCFALVWDFYRDKVDIDAYSEESFIRAVAGEKFEQVPHPRPGDIVSLEWKGRPHCGIYIGTGKFIHASEFLGKVSVSRIAAGDPVYLRLKGE